MTAQARLWKEIVRYMSFAMRPVSMDHRIKPGGDERG
jgi:hypothetical protein